MLCVVGILIISLLQFQTLSAQNLAEFSRVKAEKPKIFEQLPSKFSLNLQAIEKIFSFKANDKVVLPVSATRFIEGTVLEKVQRSEELTSMNITSSNFDGAMLTLSRITRAGEAVRYIGRLVSMKSGDAYMITIQGNALTFSKQKQSLLVAE